MPTEKDGENIMTFGKQTILLIDSITSV